MAGLFLSDRNRKEGRKSFVSQCQAFSEGSLFSFIDRPVNTECELLAALLLDVKVSLLN